MKFGLFLEIFWHIHTDIHIDINTWRSFILEETKILLKISSVAYLVRSKKLIALKCNFSEMFIKAIIWILVSDLDISMKVQLVQKCM